METISKQKHIHYTLVVVIPIIATIIPFLMPKNEGYHENKLAGLDKDCWVGEWSQYIFIIAITTSIIFHYSVLLVAVIQFKKYKEFAAFSFQYYQIVVKLSRFVIVYTIIRFFPLIERLWELSANGNVPYWLVLLQHLSIAVLGCGNAIVWFWNQSNETTFLRRYNQRLQQFQEQRQKQPFGRYQNPNNFNNSTFGSTDTHIQNGATITTQQDINESLTNTTTVTNTITTTATSIDADQMRYNHSSRTEKYGDV